MKSVAIQTRRLSTYPAYKDSGIEWIGEIPEHWQILRLKYIADAKFSNVDKHSIEGEEPVRLCNYVDAYYNDYIHDGLDFMKATATRTEIRRFSVTSGDVIITKDSEAWDDIAVAAYVPDDLDGVLCGYHLAQIRPTEGRTDGEYLFRSFCSRGINDQFRVEATGVTRFGLGKYALDNALFVLPPLPEQRAIAAFLDRETVRIDGLIEKKQRQIELLQEKRAALISHAVTKGLNPNAKMKDSDIEWLGEIPEHWKIIRFKRCTEFITSGPRGWAEYFSENGELFIRIGNLNRDSIDLDCSDIQRVSPPVGAEAFRTRVRPGDILISITADLGSVAVVPGDIESGFISQHIALARPRCKRNTPKWLGYSIFSDYCKSQLHALGYGGTKVQLSLEDVRNLVICVPPLEEQRCIVSWLDDETSRHSMVIGKISESLVILQEYRTAVISAAVTGKIDVRGENA